MARARSLRARFVVGSLVLHALLVGLSATRRHPLIERPRANPAEVELELSSDTLAALPEEAPVAARELPPAATATALRGGARPTAPLAKPVGDEPALGAEGEAALEASESAGPAVAEGPRLSLDQLGVGRENPFLEPADPVKARAAQAKAVQRRLDRALSQGVKDADVERGHGVHGGVIRVLEAAIYASNVPLNGHASMVFVIDGSGKLLSATLGDATGDRAAWLRVAQSITPPRLAKKGRGVKLTVAVRSRLVLPSGADPGLEVSMQGVPLKKGDGPRSTRLDLSIFPFPAATLAGDPADIGAHARRMVHANVVSEELL